MKLPGRAWLEFETIPVASGKTEIRQTAIFDPVGLSGLAYWYLLYPLHALIFKGMLNRIGRHALRPQDDQVEMELPESALRQNASSGK